MMVAITTQQVAVILLIICFHYPAATCPLCTSCGFDQSILGMASQVLISLAVFSKQQLNILYPVLL